MIGVLGMASPTYLDFQRQRDLAGCKPSISQIASHAFHKRNLDSDGKKGKLIVNIKLKTFANQ